MPPKSTLRKIIDDRAKIRCASGRGSLREEAWEDEHGEIVRYNLAFINRFMTTADNGRVLGYDNAHGVHHRHFYGAVEAISFTGYEDLARVFYDEVRLLRKEKR